MTAKTARKIHGILMIFWGINMIVVWFMPPHYQIPYLMAVSIYANFVGHWGAYAAERPSEIEE